MRQRLPLQSNWWFKSAIRVTTIAIIVTIMSGVIAKTVPIAFTWANTTGNIVISAETTAASRATTGIGAIAIQIKTSRTFDWRTQNLPTRHDKVEEGFGVFGACYLLFVCW